MPYGQGPLSYMYDSAAMNKGMGFFSNTAPATPLKPMIPKMQKTPVTAPTTPAAPSSPSMSTSSNGGMGKMSFSKHGGLCKIAYTYYNNYMTIHKTASRARIIDMTKDFLVKKPKAAAQNAARHYQFNSDFSGPGLKRYNPFDRDPSMPASAKMFEVPFTAAKDANKLMERSISNLPPKLRDNARGRIKPLIGAGAGGGGYGIYKLNE